MKQHMGVKTNYLFPVKKISVIAIVLLIVVFINLGFKNEPATTIQKNEIVNKDSVESVKAFMKVYKVLMSPRCLNCHPSGDVPLQ